MIEPVFPSNPYEGQIFYHAEAEKTYECVFRDPLDRMINNHLAHYVWCDITDDQEKPRNSSGSLRF
tara:strand:- start:755 stop:952 length:198 start_codon:yes stop_codon:yes gene_type:complete